MKDKVEMLTVDDELSEVTLRAFKAQYSRKDHIADLQTLTILHILASEDLAQHSWFLRLACPFVKNGTRIDDFFSSVNR